MQKVYMIISNESIDIFVTYMTSNWLNNYFSYFFSISLLKRLKNDQKNQIRDKKTNKQTMMIPFAFIFVNNSKLVFLTLILKTIHIIYINEFI